LSTIPFRRDSDFDNSLGSVLERQGKYEEAEAMHRQALRGYEKVLGPEHPDALTVAHSRQVCIYVVKALLIY
jgi:hypothetical protein